MYKYATKLLTPYVEVLFDSNLDRLWVVIVQF